MRDFARRVRSEYLLCSVTSASIANISSCSGMNSSTTIASRGLCPSPPPALTMKPCWPSRLTATTPQSCSMACAQSDSQAEKLILNLRGNCWFSGLRKKCLTTPSRCCVTSTCSRGHTPDRLQAVILRTVLLHASRVVMPTWARRRIAAGVLSSGTKCVWIDWRVVMCAMPFCE